MVWRFCGDHWRKWTIVSCSIVDLLAADHRPELSRLTPGHGDPRGAVGALEQRGREAANGTRAKNRICFSWDAECKSR